MSEYTSFLLDILLNTKTYPFFLCNCIVHFRPRGDSFKNAEFGFDWVRVGDSGAWCDKDGWRDNPKKDGHYANLMGKYYQTGTNTVCDDLNGWEKMKDKSLCTFKNEISLYEQYLKETFPIRYISLWKKKKLPFTHIPATMPEDVKVKEAVEKSQYIYYVPLMTIRNGATAQLKALMDIESKESAPLRIEVRHTSESGTSPFEITNGVISSPSAGRSDAPLTIKCIAEFSDFQLIDAYAVYNDPASGKEVEKLCGQIRVHPNNVIRSADMLLVKVKLEIGRSKTEGPSLSNTERAKLKRVFTDQSLIDCTYDPANPAHNYELTIKDYVYGETMTKVDTQTTTTPITPDPFTGNTATGVVPGTTTNTNTTETPIVVIKVETKVETEVTETQVITKTTKTTTTTQRFKLFGNADPQKYDWVYWDSAESKYKFKNRNGINDLMIIAFKKDLADEAATAAIGSAVADVSRYDNYIKVFTFDNPHDTAAGINDSSSHSILLFTRYTDETFAHEMAHALGLHHPFVASELDAAARFTYRAKKTDNILDYSHMDSKIRHSLWYWQMQEMWRQIDNRTGSARVIPTQASNETDFKTLFLPQSTPKI